MEENVMTACISKGLFVDGGVKAMRETNWFDLEGTRGQMRVVVSRSIFRDEIARIANAMGVESESPDRLIYEIQQQLNADMMDGTERESTYDVRATETLVGHILRCSSEPDPTKPWYLVDGSGLYPLSGDYVFLFGVLGRSI